jgi:hypothetical protein
MPRAFEDHLAVGVLAAEEPGAGAVGREGMPRPLPLGG